MSKSKDKPNKIAMEVAVAYLANRMRTDMELRKHLAEKGYGQSEIDEVLQELVNFRYIDDYLYAVRYYMFNYEKNRGHIRAQRELSDKGVDQETIRNAYEDFLYENKINEYELALMVANQEVFTTSDIIGDEETTIRKEINDKLIAKIARKLEARGFSNGDIIKVLGEIRRYERS